MKNNTITKIYRGLTTPNEVDYTLWDDLNPNGGLKKFNKDTKTWEMIAESSNSVSKDYVDNEISTVTSAIDSKLDSSYTDIVDTQLNTKVDKQAGKNLSTNDYTTSEKTKLSGIAASAVAIDSVNTAISEHNSYDSAHSDIRGMISDVNALVIDLTNRVAALEAA